MSDIHAILFSNESFYLAFARGDMTLMDSLWSETTPVSCAHPGWELVSGREAVMESWQSILGAADDTFAVECHRPVAHFVGNLGYVACYEVLDEATLLATNIFVHEDGIWKLVHHHAGPSTLPPDDAPSEAGGGGDIPDTLQ